MGHSHPLANKRLQEAIAAALGPDARFGRADPTTLRRVLCSVTQEKRFIVLMFMKQSDAWLTDYEIADGVRDLRANVKRNLYVLLAERVVLAKRDSATGIVRFRINRDVMEQLAGVFSMAV